MSDSRPVGVFDSGLGGLTVVRELCRLLPNEQIFYLGDTARVPYGNRSDETVKRFGVEDARYLMKKNIKMLIVACNTVSSVALEHIRNEINEIPVIGVVLPGAKAAVMRTAERKIGVIGTSATIRTEAYSRAIHSIDRTLKVYGKACPLFVPLVEEGFVDSEITRMTSQYYLYDLIDLGIDCLILGCTHYPLLLEVLQETVGNRVQLVDSALWTAKEAQDILIALDSLTENKNNGLEQSIFYVTDFAPHFEKRAERFLGHEIPKVELIRFEDMCG
jgi:glutamate racemase